MRSRFGDGRGAAAARRAADRLRRAELAEARIARQLGEPALFAIVLGAVGSSIYLVLGVVAGDALGLTPAVFAVAALLFAATLATYVEGNSLHPERGGASTFARYAFNEVVSFIAGWAIILDYVIVIALCAFAVPTYLSVFWGEVDQGVAEVLVGTLTLAFIAWVNVRGVSARRLTNVMRLSLLNIVLFGIIMIFGFATLFDAGLILDSIDLGRTPEWDDLIFAAVVATIAATGIEAASGLAGDLRVGRRGLRRFAIAATASLFLLLGGMSVLALMAVPVEGGSTALGTTYAEAPMVGVVSGFEQDWARDAFRYAVAVMGTLVLVQAANGQMLGVARLTYSLARNRQVPSLLGRLHERYATPYVAIGLAAVVALGLLLPADLDFLVGLFAFGALLSFTIAHVSVIVLRFREADRPSAFRVPLSIKIRGGSIPIPTALGALLSAAGWVSVIVLHEGARITGAIWLATGVALYVVYRRGQDKPLGKRFTIPEEALLEGPEQEYGSILVPVTGDPLDDDIVGTAGRLAAERAEEGEGGAMLEALFVFEIPMSLPIDARVPDERVDHARRALNRAKEVGEEYEGVEVATVMVRGRSAGASIVSEAKRRGVEAIVLAAEEPSRVRGGTLLGGRARARDRFVGDTTRYVVEKATCKVILTAPPAQGTRPAID